MDIQVPHVPAAAEVVQSIEAKNAATFPSKAKEGLIQTVCQDINGDGGVPGWADRDLATNTVIVLQKIPAKYGKTWHAIYGKGKELAIPTLLTGPQHGRLKLLPSGLNWQYYPNPGYEGKDQATFQVETPKGSYKVVVNLWVTNQYNEYAKQPDCRKVFKLGDAAPLFESFLSDIAAWQHIADLSALLSGWSSTSFDIERLAGTAVAQTTG